jgi:hypothetical protein
MTGFLCIGLVETASRLNRGKLRHPLFKGLFKPDDATKIDKLPDQTLLLDRPLLRVRMIAAENDPRWDVPLGAGPRDPE